MLKKSTALFSLLFIGSHAFAEGDFKKNENTDSTQPSIPPALTADQFITENDELIVAINLRDNMLLSDGIIAYQMGDDIGLPLEQLMFLLEFPIQLSGGAKQASGWFIDEKRRFSLDLNAGKVSVNGQSFTIRSSDVRIVESELYIPSQLLTQWFPLNFEANLRALTVNIRPKESIAIDERLTRKGKNFGVTYRIRSVNPEVETPYKAFTLPALDVNLNTGYSESTGTSFGNYTVRAYSDLAFMNSQLSLTGSNNGLTDARIKLSRENPRGGLLGKLDATEVQLGDINARSVPLIRNSTSGRGFAVSSRPTDYASGGERVTLDGSIELGYDVELYRNDILIDAIWSSTDTQYKFADIELFGGDNVFRLEFYGKQGQRRTETKQYFVGASQVKTGQLLYDVAVSQPGKTVFGLKDDDDFELGDLSAIARVDYGLKRNLTVSGGVATTPTREDEKASTYAFAGLNTQLGRFYTSADIAVDDAGGSAVGVNATTKFNAVRLSADHKQYFDRFFIKGNETSSTYTASQSSIRAEFSPKKLFDTFSVGGSLDGNLTINNTGDKNYQINNRLDFRVKQLLLSNNLRYSYTSNSEAETLKGNTRLNLNLRGLGIRLEADYDALATDKKLTEADASLSYTFGKGYASTLGYSHNYLNDYENVSASLTKDFKFASLGVTASHRESNNPLFSDDNSVFLTASFKTFTDPKTFKTDFYNKNGGGNSGVRTTVFVDENQNSTFDLGEELVAGAKLFGFGRKTAVSDKSGQALLRGSGNGGWSDINLDVDSLSDPSWRPAKTGVAVLARPGVVSEVELPVIITADIEGTVYLARQEGEQSPLANIEIQAVRSNALTGEEEVVKSAFTAFDGYYSLSGIPTGQITLRIDPEQVKRLSVREEEAAVSILLDKDVELISDQDFILVRDIDEVDMDMMSTDEDIL